MKSTFYDFIQSAETIEAVLITLKSLINSQRNAIDGTIKPEHQKLIADFETFINSILDTKKSLLKRAFMIDIDELQQQSISDIDLFFNGIEKEISGVDPSSNRDLDNIFQRTKDSVESLVYKTERHLGVLQTSLPASASNALELDEVISKANTQASTLPHQTNTQKTQYLFSTISAEFISEKLAGNLVNQKTADQYTATFNLFVELFGNIDIADINANTCRDFKANIQKYPTRKNSTPRFKELTFEQIKALNSSSYQTISLETVNKHITRMSSFIEWAVNQGYASNNYMKGMKITLNKSSNEKKRLPFDSDDLEKIFTHKIFSKNKFEHPYYFWLPLISLYSGARIQEISQLELNDIKEIDDILIFDINKDSPLKKLKNTSSQRLIPVHEKLIDIGLLNEISRLRRLKKKYLFEELHQKPISANGQHDKASDWFGRFKNSLKLEPKEKKVFHSFRHTFAQSMMTNEVPEHITASLMGHTHEKLTYGTYGGSIDIKILNKHVQQIQYEAIDKLSIRWRAK